MTETKKNCWLVRTGQMWKLRLALVFVCAGVLLMTLSSWNIYDFELVNSYILLMGLISFILLFFSIRCPACKGRPAYRIARTYGIDEWFFVLLTFENCPICGYSGNSSDDIFNI